MQASMRISSFAPPVNTTISSGSERESKRESSAGVSGAPMPDRDIVLAKIAAIERCIQRVREPTCGHPASLEELDRQDIFVRNPPRASQSAIDLAGHIV